MFPTDSIRQRRIRELAAIKAVLATVVLIIMLITFPRPLPLFVSVLDLALVPVYLLLAHRWPATATYLLIAQTALALTPRQFVQGYVNGVNWLLYVPLPLAARYVIGTRRAALIGSLIVTAVAVPVMAAAILTLPPRLERADLLALAAYVLVDLWGIWWLSRGTPAADQPTR